MKLKNQESPHSTPTSRISSHYKEPGMVRSRSRTYDRHSTFIEGHCRLCSVSTELAKLLVGMLMQILTFS